MSGIGGIDLSIGLGIQSVYQVSGIVIDPDKFAFSVQTDNTGDSTDTQFELPLVAGQSYNFDIDWGDGNTETITTNTPQTHEYGTAGTYTIQIGGVNKTFPRQKFGGLGDRRKILDIMNWGLIVFNSMDGSYNGCSNLTISATDTALTSTVSIWDFAFKDCISLITVPAFNMSAGFSLEGFLQGCISVTTVGALTTTSINTSLDSAFRSMTALTSMDFTNFVTSGVTDMDRCFLSTPYDPDLSSWDITSLTTATFMMLLSSFSQTNYDLMLVAWEGQTELINVVFHAGTAKYGAGAPATARGVLTGTSTWTITDGGAA